MRKLAFIIPGGHQSAKSKPYKDIANFFQQRGIKPILVEINWERTTLSDNIEQFMKQFRKYKADEVYVLGFSWGAMIAFISSQETKPKLQILCSLSPYFREDLPFIKHQWRTGVGKHRMNDFKNYSFDKISRKVKNETILLFGSKEPKQVYRRNRLAFKKLRCKKKIIFIKNAKHDIRQKEYLTAVKKVIEKIE
jgi:esterase/lipase